MLPFEIIWIPFRLFHQFNAELAVIEASLLRLVFVRYTEYRFMSRFVRIFLGMFFAIPTNQHNKHSPEAIRQTRLFFLQWMSYNKNSQHDRPLRSALSVYIHFPKHPLSKEIP